jgi:hypothetical protein
MTARTTLFVGGGLTVGEREEMELRFTRLPAPSRSVLGSSWFEPKRLWDGILRRDSQQNGIC